MFKVDDEVFLKQGVLPIEVGKIISLRESDSTAVVEWQKTYSTNVKYSNIERCYTNTLSAANELEEYKSSLLKSEAEKESAFNAAKEEIKKHIDLAVKNLEEAERVARDAKASLTDFYSETYPLHDFLISGGWISSDSDC